MPRHWICLLAFVPVCWVPAKAQSLPGLNDKRQLPTDLEVSGALAGLPPESTRYISRAELLAMPQVTFIVTDDANFTGPAKIRGVRLEDLMRSLEASPNSDMAVAICDDAYRASYPQEYIKAHHPVLVLEVNGKPPSGWPKAADDHVSDMGPYMISNPRFVPSFKVLSHSDEAQIPWGVVRIEFQDEKRVFGAIAPRGPRATDRAVQDGFRIAEQDCFRCHNSGSEGGRKAGRSWKMLARRAAVSPKDFAAYVRAPNSINPRSQMPANPEYDGATLAALTAYFRTFSTAPKP